MPFVEVDPIELELNQKTPDQPTYTFHTLQALQSRGTDFSFVIGTDQLDEIQKWHRFPEVMGLCHWIVLARAPHGADVGRTAIRRLREAGLPWLVAVTNNGFNYTYAYKPEVRVVKRRSAGLAAARSAA
jgi:nicotinic acid mononucleotide adenylyltransferase